ncbi:hypothetical protein GGI20_003588 [Coemansia sp. BCRC 34301]|nr:hypothetical protein GGI20_003588 [Coemansia sp. BCRC 34301]
MHYSSGGAQPPTFAASGSSSTGQQQQQQLLGQAVASVAELPSAAATAAAVAAAAAATAAAAAATAASSGSAASEQQLKKKRLTQACQHCRKKKIRCDGIRPSCNNCTKNKSPCTYLPSVRKRGRNGMRAAMHPSFAVSTSHPYSRSLHSQQQQQQSSSSTPIEVTAASNHQPMAMQQAQMLPPSQHHHHHQQQMFHVGHHGMLPPPPPPPPPLSQMAPPPQPHVNPLGVSFMDGGPVSLHLKRDPGFGIDPMDESMYDTAKQAYEASSHFMLPVNNFHYSGYAPPPANQSLSSSMHAGPSSSSSGSRKPMGIPGTSCFPVRTPSGSSMGYNADIFPSTSGIASMAGQSSSLMSSKFDPTTLAQDLSSAYVSVIAGMPPADMGSGRFQSNSQDAVAPAKSATARGKSASHTLGSALDSTTFTKMRELRKQIRAIISSVWADTECGKSAGMAGVSVAADDEQANDDDNSHQHSTPKGVQQQPLASLSGDRSMDDHLLNIYFECVHHQLPIIQRAEFYAMYGRGTVPPLLVCAMCAAASVFLNRIEDERKAICDRYAQKVRELFHDACFEPSLEVVQTALIMTLCEYRHGSLHRAWVYLSMGFRLAIAMGYHHHDAKLRAGPMQSSADISRRESCRRAFWGAFLLDRYTAIGGGKPLGINDSDISVLLPLRDEDWQNPTAPPPLKFLEFFKPTTSLVLSSKSSSDQAATARGNAEGSDGSSPRAGGSSNGDSMVQSRNGSPVSTSESEGSGGWNSRAGESSALGCFVKLMAVVGQVAQHINGTKSPGGGADHRPDRPTRDYAVLDAALLRWKEELPASLLYSQAKALETEPESAVTVACMHAIYHGAVIMLNRENMGLLRDLPGQLDVSTNLAIRSLERCRVAAMEVVEIAHHLCALPSAMTNALLPWALFQAGTLLIHFMIAGSSPQAQEEARSAILSLDSVLRDELSRYWNVSSKYHLVLSNMVKAWERTRQSTPSLTPRQPTPAVHNHHQQQHSALGDSAADTFQALNAQICLPMQMQMHMQLPPAHAPAPPPSSSSQMQMAEPFSTLLKPFSVPTASGSLPTPDPHGGMMQQLSSGMAETPAQQQKLNDAMTVGGSMPSFMFTQDTAQDSLNTLNVFLSQLSQEQARQINEGLQTYSLQNDSTNAHPLPPPMSSVFAARNTSSGPSEHSMASSSGMAFVGSNDTMLANATLHQMHSFAPGFDGSVNTSRLQIRRGSLPISSNGDLFIAPGARTVFPTSTAPPAFVQQPMMASELDPLLFNPMTPFLHELRLFNSLPAQQQPTQQQGLVMSAGSSSNTAAGNLHDPNGNMR